MNLITDFFNWLFARGRYLSTVINTLGPDWKYNPAPGHSDITHSECWTQAYNMPVDDMQRESGAAWPQRVRTNQKCEQCGQTVKAGTLAIHS